MKYVLYMKVISYEKIYEGYFFLKELSNEELFQEELIQNEEIIWKLADTIVSVTNEKRCVCFDWSAILEESQDSQFEDIEYIEIPPEKRIEIEKMEIVQYDNLNKLNLFNKRFENSELDDFIKVFNQKNSQTVQTPTPAASADSAPGAVPAVAADSVPSGFVPAVIQGEFAEIQGSVYDSKRKTTLTEQKKTNAILERIDEKLGQVVENTSSGNAKPKTRLEELREIYLKYRAKHTQNSTRYLMKLEENCSYEEIWKIEHWGEDWDAVDPDIRKQEITNIRSGVSQARPKKS